jgi:hypothetical protein
MDYFELAAVLSPIASAVFAFFAFKRNQRVDYGQAAREMGVILTEIGYIKSQNDDLRRKLESYSEMHARLAERVSLAEESLRIAVLRIDAIMQNAAFKDAKIL